MSPQQAARLLLDDLSRCAPPLSPPDETLIRERLHVYVDRLKESGLGPEKVLVEVKDVAARAAIHSIDWQMTPNDGSRLRASLLEQLVRWAIARYYSTD